MIKLSFVGPQRKIIRFEIEGKIVRYFDELWKDGIQIYPLDTLLINRLKINRNLNIRLMAALILDANKGKNLEEYNNCKTEEDLARLIRKDCKLKGLIEIK